MFFIMVLFCENRPKFPVPALEVKIIKHYAQKLCFRGQND